MALLIFIIIGLIVSVILLSPLIIKQRRKRLKRHTFPPLWNSIIENNLLIYSRLSPAERRRLQGHIQVFLTEKQFIGCQGLQVTEEMKLTIAGISCLLLLNERGEYFPKLRSILIYPGAYFVNEIVANGNYVVEERRVARLGESWTKDQVVLSWEQVQQDTQNWSDGHNVVLHEFAHQLDQEDGKAEGVPILQRKSDYLTWARVMTEEYHQLCNDVQQGIKTVMDGYGATNPAEFFAVATETFFEKPQELLKKHPALYELLQRYYQLDPVQWV
ncbi:zinc-dependent peptidase [Nostoc sp. CENA67]|uniref:Zinc-dependent peptidase n=1 Tax=Amazonocrinis nigriterrae CENA67 TaxID=2794033 RepID=A0A8J7HPX6_9NOST|nr:M90 family metallopeptidase [Amazonocrinis nigriterrae]MBH8563412.1 zinc-dependent peptidase [Amazonocrinis nigriterrae CENA67]